MEKRIFGKCSDGRVGEEKSKQNIAFVVYCVSSHPDEKYGKIQIPEEGTAHQSFMGSLILQAIHGLLLHKKTRRKKNKKTKIPKD